MNTNTEFDITETINAGFSIEPIRCRFCNEPEVAYHQYIGDGYCSACGEWQLDQPRGCSMTNHSTTDTPLTALRALYDAVQGMYGSQPYETIISQDHNLAAMIEAMRRSSDILTRYRANTDPWTADTIRELRKAHGLTQVQMAETIGVSLHNYREWEQGRGNPGHENSQRLSALAQKGQGAQ